VGDRYLKVGDLINEANVKKDGINKWFNIFDKETKLSGEIHIKTKFMPGIDLTELKR